MKILFLTDKADHLEQFILSFAPEVKVISEREITADTPYISRFLKAGYSLYLTTRAGHLIRAYRANRPLAVVLDQRHQDAVEKILVDKTIRVVDNLIPNRLSHGTSYKVDEVYTSEDFDDSVLRELYSLDNTAKA
jgi:hypothetical protein